MNAKTGGNRGPRCAAALAVAAAVAVLTAACGGSPSSSGGSASTEPVAYRADLAYAPASGGLASGSSGGRPSFLRVHW